jgi:hypothetical protein
VTITAGGAGATAASEADKARTTSAPATKVEGGDICIVGQQPTPDPQAGEAGGACVEVVADHHDVEVIKEASRTIGRMLSVRVLG